MTRRLLLAALAVVLALIVDGTASAYWRTSGHGNSSGATGTTAAVQLSPATPATAVYPGGQTDLALTISNPNTSAVRLGSLALATGQGTGGFAVDAGHSGCVTSTLSFTTQTTGWIVPAKAGAVNGVLPVTLPNALAMSASAANACQGSSITAYLAAS
jgi:hypothetical protein